ncbi:MAG: hypothetical protein ACLP7P_20225 [Rhodomicrobium sp.]
MSAKMTYQKELEEAIAGVLRTGLRQRVQAPDRTDVYGYPRLRGRVAWGIDHPSKGIILRGIRNPDGTDQSVM